MTEVIESMPDVVPVTPPHEEPYPYVPSVETLDVIRVAQREESIRKHRQDRLALRNFNKTIKPLMDNFVKTVMPNSTIIITVDHVDTRERAFEQLVAVREFATNMKNKSEDKPEIIFYCNDFIDKIHNLHGNLQACFQ